MKKLFFPLALVTGLAAAPAFAQQQPSWYFGFGIGQGHLNMSGQDLAGLEDASVNKTDTSYTLRAGYRFHPNFAAEVAYYDLGSYGFNGTLGNTAVSGSGKAKAYGVSLVGIAPMGPAFDIYARVGWADSQIKTNANTELLTTSASDWQGGATYGVGGRWNFSRNIGLFGEWMKNDKIEVDSYLFGLDFSF
jgi:hypothetical protein